MFLFKCYSNVNFKLWIKSLIDILTYLQYKKHEKGQVSATVVFWYLKDADTLLPTQ